MNSEIYERAMTCPRSPHVGFILKLINVPIALRALRVHFDVGVAAMLHALTCAMCIVHASRERGFYWSNKSIRTSAKWMNAERINSNLLRMYSRFRHCSVRSVHWVQSKIRKVVLSGWDLLIFRRRREAIAYGAERQRFGGVSEGNDVRECVCVCVWELADGMNGAARACEHTNGIVQMRERQVCV